MDPHSGKVENQSAVLRNLEASLTSLSSIFLLVRLYSRLRYTKNAGLDDVIAIIAWAFISTQSSLELYGTHHWTGRHIWTLSPAQIEPFFSHLPKVECLFFISTGIVRLSIVAFLPRLNKNKSVPFRRIIISLATAITVVTIVFFIFFVTSCRPVGEIWHQKPTSKCLSYHDQTILVCTHQGLGAVFDLCLLCVPIWLVYTHMTLNWRTIKVMLVFGVGLFVFAVGIVRFVVILKVDMTKDPSWNIVHIAIWSALEIHVGFWVACFPAFVPLIRRAYGKVVLGTNSHGSIPMFNPARSPGAKARKKRSGFTSTGDGTESERVMTSAAGTIGTTADVELVDMTATTQTDVGATTNKASDDTVLHDSSGDMPTRTTREPV